MTLRRIRAGRKLIYLALEAQASAYSTRVAVAASDTSVAAWWELFTFFSAVIFIVPVGCMETFLVVEHNGPVAEWFVLAKEARICNST